MVAASANFQSFDVLELVSSISHKGSLTSSRGWNPEIPRQNQVKGPRDKPLVLKDTVRVLRA